MAGGSRRSPVAATSSTWAPTPSTCSTGCLGPVTHASGVATNRGGRYPAEDLVTAAFSFRSGVQGVGLWNYDSFRYTDQVEVIGTEGALRFSCFADEPLRLVTARGVEQIEAPYPEIVQLPLIQAVVDALTGGGASPSDGQQRSENGSGHRQVALGVPGEPRDHLLEPLGPANPRRARLVEETVRAVAFDSFGGPLRVVDAPRPECAPDGVVIDVRATGVCRSDWHAWRGHDPVSLPHVPGHEFAGEIAEIGPQVSRFAVGERVTVPFVVGCGRCEWCRSGQAQVVPIRPSRDSPRPARSLSRSRSAPPTSTWFGSPTSWTSSPRACSAAGSPPRSTRSPRRRGFSQESGSRSTAAAGSASRR